MFNRISRNTRRRTAALLLALLAVPAIWWRSDVPRGDAGDLQLVELADFESGEGELQVTGLWEVTSADLLFGGYSAMLVDDRGVIRTWSDRGRLLTFAAPGQAARDVSIGVQLPDPGMEQRLWDIESATRDPATGRFWLGYEGTHGIQRFGAAGEPDGHVLFPDMPWQENGGMESLVRLADGRFAALPETEARLYFFAGDPVRDAGTTSIPVDWPATGYLPTDAAQLPDGRLLVLMRRVVWDLPPTFDSILVVGTLPQDGETWRPELALTLHDLVPRDNFEGMDVVARADGGADIWIISDDNFSAFQRTLLVRLELAAPEVEAELDAAHEKAREDRSPRAFSRVLAG